MVTEALPPTGRLRWLCRRGTKELDRIMGGFLEEAYPHADLETQAAFVRLLYCQDPDIYDWVMGAEEPKEPDLKMIISILQTKYGISPDR